MCVEDLNICQCFEPHHTAVTHLPKDAADGFLRKPEIIRDIGPAHGKGDMAHRVARDPFEPRMQVEDERRYALHGCLAAQHYELLLRGRQFLTGNVQKGIFQDGVVGDEILEPGAWKAPYPARLQCLCSDIMCFVDRDAKKLPWKCEARDLPASVEEKLIKPEATAGDGIDEVSFVALME